MEVVSLSKKDLKLEETNAELGKKLQSDPKFNEKFQKVAKTHGKEVREKFEKDLGKIKLGSGIVILAVIAGIVASNIRGKSKQGKMILQAACDAWNAEYDKKITIKDIKKMIAEDKLSHKVMKDVKKAKTSDVKKAEAHDKLHFKK